jgi:hypothetical protein
VFCHMYPTKTCVPGNGKVRSFWENVSLTQMGGHSIARNDGDYQHRGGRGPGSDGMANICEPLTNVVRTNKPKVLNKVGLNQKVRG